MKVKKEQLRLYGITDRRMLLEHKMSETQGQISEEARYQILIREALMGGVTMLQLREKDLPQETYVKRAGQVLEITKQYHIPLIINDDPAVALLSGADGVHVGQEDETIRRAREILGENRIIGATAHNLEEALEAWKQGADYLGVGAAFGSTTKKDARPIDRETYRSICESVPIPVVAIGGITADNLGELSGRGLSGIAVIGAIFGVENIKEGARSLRAKVEKLL
ncbi:MAG: thiamine phosphate synthase [Lachnospiraceae bacterium]|nr:thiamine phosphate synthase [Lachnospiraceae bacterium]